MSYATFQFVLFMIVDCQAPDQHPAGCSSTAILCVMGDSGCLYISSICKMSLFARLVIDHIVALRRNVVSQRAY